MIKLIAFLLGILVGLLWRRQLRPLLFERWQALSLLPIIFLACLLPYWFNRFWPELIWTSDRKLLISLIAFQYLLGLLFLALNCFRITLPGKTGRAFRPPVRWFHRAALVLTGCGLIAEAAVLLSNHGYMPISANYLNGLGDPAAVAGFQNQAFYLKQLIDSQTRLKWLGQIWHWDFLLRFKLSNFPYVSPAEVLTAAGLFATGLSQFFKRDDFIKSSRLKS